MLCKLTWDSGDVRIGKHNQARILKQNAYYQHINCVIVVLTKLSCVFTGKIYDMILMIISKRCCPGQYMCTYREGGVGVDAVGGRREIDLLVALLTVIPRVTEAHVSVVIIRLQLLDDLRHNQTAHDLKLSMKAQLYLNVRGRLYALTSHDSPSPR